MSKFDPYRGGQKAFALGLTPPSIKPRGMNEHHWREWVRGWEDAAMKHAEDQAAKQDEQEGKE